MQNYRDSKLLIVGLGSIGQRHTQVLRELGVKNLTVTDANSAAVDKALARYPGVQAVSSLEEGLTRRPDAVFILTPPKLHVPMAMKAAEAGCHVFCEKPVADTLRETAPLRETLKRTGVTFATGLCSRFHPGVLRMKDMLDSGEYGRVVSIRALMGEHLPTVRPDYKTLFSAQYTGVFDLMHDIDLALWMANQPVKDCRCIYGTYGDIGIQAADLAEFLVVFEGRCLANIHLDFIHQPRSRELELICTNGTLRLEFAAWDRYTLSAYRPAAGTWEHTTFDTARNDMFSAEDEAFLRHIAGGTGTVFGLDEGLKSLSLIEQSRQAPAVKA